MLKILGVKIDSITFEQAITKIDKFICDKKPSQIVTVNPEFIMAAQKDKLFKKILNQADLAVADGFGLILASRYLGKPLKERIAGVDLTWAICKLAEDRGYSVFFLGGAEGIAKKTALRIKKIHQRLRIAGTFAGKPRDAKTLEMIKKTKPDILLVAFGAPKQDKFIYDLNRSKDAFHPPLAIGVGGTFDYITGVVPRAPELIRTLGLEWLYRLFKQPFRFRRIFTAIVLFPLAVLKQKIIK